MSKIHKERLYKKVECKKENVIVCVVDRNVLQNPQQVFQSYIEDLEQVSLESKPVMIPKETIRAFYTLQYMFNQPTVSIVGNQKNAEPKKSLFFSPSDIVNVRAEFTPKHDMMEEEAEEYDDDEEGEDCSTVSSVSSDLTDKESNENEPGEILNKVDEYVQEIYNNGVLIGWRFFFIILDPSYDIDRYLEEWFDFHLRSKRYQQNSGLANGFNSELGYTSKSDWVQQGITMYTREKFTQQKESLHHELCSSKNPANVYRIFDFAQSCAHLRHMRADSHYLDTESYFPEDGCIVFPSSVYHVSYKFRDPNELIVVNWVDLLSDQENSTNTSFFANEEDQEEEEFEDHTQQDNLTEEERLYSRTKRFKPTFCAGNRAATTKYISKCKEAMTKEEFFTFKCSKQITDLVYSLLEHDKKINANVHIYRWYRTQKFERNCWSPFAEGREDVKYDKKLSFFGNMIRRHLVLIERHCKVNHLHHELLICFHSLLGATDQHRISRLVHFILTGLPSAGKSYLLDLLASHVAIEGTVIPKNMTTQGVTSASHVENGFVVSYDEMPDDFFKKSEKNKLLPILKSIWSSGRARIQKVSRKGIVTFVDFENFSNHLLNCNPATCIMEPGLHSRSISLYCPGRTRSDGKSFDGTPDLSKDEGLFYEFKLIQYHCAMINLLISIGLMSDVDISHAKLLFETVKIALNQRGLALQERQKDQFLAHCRHVTKCYAIHKVFFVGRPADGANDFIHFYKVGAFLVTTKEIAWYVMTQLFTSFFSNLQRPFLEAYRELLTIQNKQPSNPLYYSLPVKSRHQNEMRKEFMETMQLKISSGARIYPSDGNMLDTIWYFEKKQTMNDVPVIRFVSEAKSVEIHKQYMDEALQKNTVIAAIELCFDKFSPFEVDGIINHEEQDGMCIMTGISLRDESEGKPHESYLLPWVRQASIPPLKERNPYYDHANSEESDEPEFISPHENPDVRARRERIESEGLVQFFPEITFESTENKQNNATKTARGHAESSLQYDGAIVTDHKNDNVYFGPFKSYYGDFHQMDYCIKLIDFKMCVSEMKDIDEENTWGISMIELIH